MPFKYRLEPHAEPCPKCNGPIRRLHAGCGMTQPCSTHPVFLICRDCDHFEHVGVDEVKEVRRA